MTPKVKGKGTETGEPTSPKTASGRVENVPEHPILFAERVRRDALISAKRDPNHRSRYGLPSSR